MAVSVRRTWKEVYCMLNGKKRGIEAGILLAVTVWAACQTEESGLAANIAASDAFVSEMAMQEKTISNAVQTAAQEGKAAVQEAEKAAEEAAVRKEEIEPEGSFTVIYRGEKADREIELRHCDCVYDADDIQIYAEYLYWLMVPETFPYDQYVLYIRTPQEELQLYPVRDFLVDEEYGILYTKIAGDDGFEKVQGMSFTGKDGSMLDSEKEIFDAEQAEEMLRGAYHNEMGNGPDGGQALFSNITVELTGVCAGDSNLPGAVVGTDSAGLLETGAGRNGAGVLKGEIGGIEKATGQRYYADWEINMADGASSVALCVLKQYDPVKDREIFADCDRVFDQLEQGDWSDVWPIEEQYLWGIDAEEWLRMDVNGDGMPELVGGWVIEDLPDYADSRKIEVSLLIGTVWRRWSMQMSTTGWSFFLLRQAETWSMNGAYPAGLLRTFSEGAHLTSNGIGNIRIRWSDTGSRKYWMKMSRSRGSGNITGNTILIPTESAAAAFIVCGSAPKQ